MTIRRIGPIRVHPGNYQATWTGTPDRQGTRAFRINGSMRDPETARALMELASNDDRAVSVAGHVGVLEYLDAGGQEESFRGWMLIQSAAVNTSSDGDADAGWGPFTLSAVALGGRFAPLLVRSARKMFLVPGRTARSAVVRPFYTTGPRAFLIQAIAQGGVASMTRRYDIRTDASAPAGAQSGDTLNIWLGTLSDTHQDSLPPTFLPAPMQRDNEPEFAVFRGHECRAFDRRDEREVYGPDHVFQQPTDCLITNGLLRLTCGQHNTLPHVTVEVFGDGDRWHQAGALTFPVGAGLSSIRGVRLTHVTPYEVSMAIQAQHAPEVIVTLRMGERSFRITHGSVIDQRTIEREIRWLGVPPWHVLDQTARTDGKFGGALVRTAGEAIWTLTQVPADDWGFVVRWRPSDGSGDQPSSGLLQALKGGSAVAEVWWDEIGAVRLATGGALLSVPLENFDAEDDVFVAVAHDGQTASLTVEHDEQVSHASAPADPTDGHLSGVHVGFSSIGETVQATFGQGDFGEHPFGIAEMAWAFGAVETMAFAGALTEAEREALAAAEDALDGLPSPEGRLVLYLHFDAELNPRGSFMFEGRRFQATQQGGSTRVVAPSGFTPVVFSTINGGLSTTAGLGIKRTSIFDIFLFAGLVSQATNDDIIDHQEQGAAIGEQHLTMR